MTDERDAGEIHHVIKYKPDIVRDGPLDCAAKPAPSPQREELLAELHEVLRTCIDDANCDPKRATFGEQDITKLRRLIAFAEELKAVSERQAMLAELLEYLIELKCLHDDAEWADDEPYPFADAVAKLDKFIAFIEQEQRG